LIRALDQAPAYEFGAELSEHLAVDVGANGCTLFLADYSEQTLEPVPGPEVRETHSSQRSAPRVSDSEAGRAFREQRMVTVLAPEVPETTVYVPVTVRSERLGVLEVRLPMIDDQILTALDDTGRITAYALAAARRYTDRFERIRRRRDFLLAAEIQWELLPVLAYDTPQFAVAGNLEPAYEIAGDTFDYAVSEERLTISITDAMGHGLRAALMGSLAVITMRNERRAGHGIIEQAHEASNQLEHQFGDDTYVTGLLIELDPRTGVGTIINAGHPPPVRLQGAETHTVDIPPDTPMGMFAETRYHLHPLSMAPGDRLLLYSDGITEAVSPHGEPFGPERVAEQLRQHRTQPPSELVRLLTTEVKRHCGDDLRDDATVVCLDWHGNQT
jgi:serine phosphatase RsbU (regulator of sigma subunit)